LGSEALMQVRAILGSATNTTGGDTRTTLGGNEVQKIIDEQVVEAFNSKTDFVRLLSKRTINQASYMWNVATEATAGYGNPNSSFAVYSEGSAGTPQYVTKNQLFGVVICYRTDYEITGLMRVVGMGNQLIDEARYAAESLATGEERMAICGSDTSAYGVTSGFDGLIQLMGSYVTFGSTDTVYGTARASGKTYLDVSLVAASATSTAALALADLDSAITLSNKRGAKGNRRIFFCSEERRDEIDSLLQPQQRFVNQSLEIEGGIRISTYKGVPIIGSRFMDKNGQTWDGTTLTDSATDNSMYLLDLDNIFMTYAGGVNAAHRPIMGANTGSATDSFQSRSDAVGGYYKSYGVFVMRRFDTQVMIYNLTDI